MIMYALCMFNVLRQTKDNRYIRNLYSMKNQDLHV